MKKIISLASIIFSLNAFSQIPNYIPTSGLVSYWSFDGNGNDLGTNANNLTTNGTVSYSTDRFGNANSAALFNGANEYFNKFSPVLPSGNAPRSLSLWCYTSGVMSNVNGESPFCYGDLISGGCYKRFEMLIKNATSIEYVGKCNPVIHNVNNLFLSWHHLVYTFGPGQTFALYQDGLLIQSSVLSGTDNTVLGELRIGSGLDDSNPIGSDAQFDGKIDEIAFYNRVLNPCEITQLYNASVFSTPTITAIGSTTLCSGNTTILSTSSVGSYTWSNGAHTQSITVSATGSYSVLVTNGSCTGNSSPISVTVNPSPTITVNNGIICNGNSFTITPNGANTYSYSSSSSIVSPTTNTNYSVIGTSSLGCISSNTAVSSVSVNPNPTVSSVSNTSLICVGQSATLTANGASIYTWSPGTLTSSNIVISPTVTTNYTVVGTNTLTGCTNQTTLTQSVSTCTGIENLSSSNNFINAYPNPTKGSVTIERTLKCILITL
jgi:hypothetical protein